MKNGDSRHAYFNFSRQFSISKNIFLLDKGINLSLIYYKTCLVQFIVGNNSKKHERIIIVLVTYHKFEGQFSLFESFYEKVSYSPGVPKGEMRMS